MVYLLIYPVLWKCFGDLLTDIFQPLMITLNQFFLVAIAGN